MATEAGERYEEVIDCQASVEQGLVFIKVVAMPCGDSVEFDVAQARGFAERILSAVSEVEAGWAGGGANSADSPKNHE